jgi:hypothetical protein
MAASYVTNADGRYVFDVMPTTMYCGAVKTLALLREMEETSDENLADVDADGAFDELVVDYHFNVAVPGIEALLSRTRERLYGLVRAHSAETPVRGVQRIKDLARKLIRKSADDWIHSWDDAVDPLMYFIADGVVMLPPIDRSSSVPAGHMEARKAFAVPDEPWKNASRHMVLDEAIAHFPVDESYVGAAASLMSLIDLKHRPGLTQLDLDHPESIDAHTAFGAHRLAAAMLLAEYLDEHEGLPSPPGFTFRADVVRRRAEEN